jgi:hypothetical protein
LKRLALTPPSTSSPAISTSASPDTPGPIGKSLFTKCININLALLRVPAAFFALRGSRQAVEEIVLHIYWLDINRGWSGRRRHNFSKF